MIASKNIAFQPYFQIRFMAQEIHNTEIPKKVLPSNSTQDHFLPEEGGVSCYIFFVIAGIRRGLEPQC